MLKRKPLDDDRREERRVMTVIDDVIFQSSSSALTFLQVLLDVPSPLTT